MKLSFSTLACPAWSTTQVIDAARRFGYDGIEWRLIDGELIDSEMNVSRAARLGDAVEAAGLSVSAVDSSEHLIAPSPSEAEQMVGRLRRMIGVAKAMRAEHLRVFMGDVPEGLTPVDAARSAAENIRMLVDDLERSGVTLAVELHNRFGPDPVPPHEDGATSSQVIMEALRHLPSRAVGVQWDWGNPYFEDEAPAETWQRIRTRLFYCHTKDIAPDASEGFRYVAMGAGVIPIPDILTWLARDGFDGWLSFEWEKKWHPELADASIALPQYSDYMRTAIQNTPRVP